MPRREYEEETGGPSWIWGVHACLAALANPRRDIRRIVATRNAALRLPADNGGVDILEAAEIDALLPPGAVHQGLAMRPGRRGFPRSSWDRLRKNDRVRARNGA